MQTGKLTKISKYAFLLMILAYLYSCSTESRAITLQDNKELRIQSPYMGNENNNSAKRSDWEGHYRGVIPCETCDAVEIELELRKPNRYKLTTIYISDEKMVLNNQGQFLWDNSGEMIILRNSTVDNNKFLFENGEIKMLDGQGREYQDALADLYILRKIQN
ncbi:MAG: copper resistance protein NlpE N-terminal domain-containing protein [Weeksellaceae bacterium]|nr:copper resistance protein NlpE N-terminal domain-containing protein [Weeksellaceae bacterium]